MSTTIIRNAVIFTPTDEIEGDLRIEDGRIVEVGEVSSAEPDMEVDVDGLWLWPGAIDGHVHFREPGPTHKEDWTTGSRAAVAGGVTTVFEMPNTRPTTTTVERLNEKRAIAESKSLCNFGLFFGANPANLEAARAATNVAGLKIFMGCSTGDLLVYEEADLEKIFQEYPRRICVHAESELRLRERTEQFKDQMDDAAIHSVIRDNESAREAVEMAGRLAAKYGRDLHVLHLSTGIELDEIDKWRAENGEISITCEVCPHHLFLDTRDYDTHGTFVRMNPPLRDPEDVETMWMALNDGRIPMIATDHAPHTIEEKSKPYREAPSGVPGVETMLPLMLDAADRGLCDHRDVLDWLCHNPAKIYGMVDRGEIRVGAHADLVVIDPGMLRMIRNKEQFSKCAWTPWHEQETTGWPVLTFVGGELAYQRVDDGVGEVVGEPGMGTEVPLI
jgi:dihydroorotase